MELVRHVRTTVWSIDSHTSLWVSCVFLSAPPKVSPPHPPDLVPGTDGPRFRYDFRP